MNTGRVTTTQLLYSCWRKLLNSSLPFLMKRNKKVKIQQRGQYNLISKRLHKINHDSHCLIFLINLISLSEKQKKILSYFAYTVVKNRAIDFIKNIGYWESLFNLGIFWQMIFILIILYIYVNIFSTSFSNQ